MPKKIKLFKIKKKIKFFVKNLLKNTKKQIVFLGILPNTLVFCYFLNSIIQNYQLELDFIFANNFSNLRIKDKNYQNKKIIICDIFFDNKINWKQIINILFANNIIDFEFLFLTNLNLNLNVIKKQLLNAKFSVLIKNNVHQISGFGIKYKNNYQDFKNLKF